MKPYQLVGATIRGETTKRTPLYGWVRENLTPELTKTFGSVENFEDYYGFDMAHLFGGPSAYQGEELKALRGSGVEITPAVALDLALKSPHNTADYQSIAKGLEHYRGQRERFCYLQTPGIFEKLNDLFTIENHLLYMALYPEELKELYHRHALWNKSFALNAIELGVDMVHVSDDWGGQNSLLFSTGMWQELIYPYHKITADAVKKAGKFLSLHSDGYVMPIVNDIIALGYDVMHPWQESAGMSYNTYLAEYSQKLGILGGLCVQTTLGFGQFERVKEEIQRVFSLLKGKRWMFCTTHFVQAHCSVEELLFAYDLASELARP